MNTRQSTIMNCILFSVILHINTTSYATNGASVEFFSSNNTHEIDVEKAYERLQGKAQRDLKRNIITVLKNNHLKQGKFENILGAYQMSEDKKVTSDNTEIFYSSEAQTFSHAQIFSLAAQLAKILNQESTAVFIPSQQCSIGDIVVKFRSHKPGIKSTIHMIVEKLPDYTTEFSLHLSSRHTEFNDAKVSKIEWIGNKINLNEIKKAFPEEDITYHQGQAYLVYKNGQVKSL